MRYRVDAEWDAAGWWVVIVPAVAGAITQCRRLDQVPADAAEVITLQTGESVSEGDLEVVPAVAGEVGALAAQARGLRVEAATLGDQVAEATRCAVHRLHDAGFPLRDIGALTGITHQRAQQILKR